MRRPHFLFTGLSELRSLLNMKRESESKTEAIIDAAYQATHGMVVSVTDAATAAGMQKVRQASRNRED